LRAPLAAWVGQGFQVNSEAVLGQIGSGALPIEQLPSQALVIRSTTTKRGGSQLNLLASSLRGLPVPVVGRIQDSSVILDCRCLDDEAVFLEQLQVRQ